MDKFLLDKTGTPKRMCIYIYIYICVCVCIYGQGLMVQDKTGSIRGKLMILGGSGGLSK